MIISPSSLSGKVNAPPSKSMSHRAIIAAALAEGTSRISNIELSDDIMSTIEAVQKLGAKIEMTMDASEKIKLNITGIAGKSDEYMPHIDCLESGSTLRFMIPVALACAGGGIFDGEGKLPLRPLDEYKRIFTEQEIIWQTQGDYNLPLKIKGDIKSGECEIAGDVSSQYISGLMFALTMLEGDSIIKIKGKLESSRYVDMTIAVLQQFGIIIDKKEDSYIIKGGQNYKATDYVVEGDWSQGAFWIVAGALGEGTSVQGLDINSKQADKKIIDILKNMGVQIEVADNSIITKKSQIKACEVDVAQCPDLAPVVAAAMVCVEGTSRISGGARLKYKESDRILSISEALNSIGANVTPTEDGMIVSSSKCLSGLKVNLHDDHRIAMMIAIISQRVDGEMMLINADCVNKSYPSFWDDFTLLGGKIR